jgi:hypothetical protein
MRKRKLRSDNNWDQDEYDPDDQDNSEKEDHPKKKIRKQRTAKSIVLAQDSPLRCQRCINAQVDCIINPAHIAKLMKWKDTPGWKSRPRGTLCECCREKKKSCRLPGMATKAMNGTPRQTMARGWGAMVMWALKYLWQK